MTWYHRILRYPEVWLLTGLALLTRLWQLNVPSAIVFDEVYFRTFPSHYLTGNYFFDIHPPLIKLLFAGIGSVFHLSAEQIATGDPGSVILRTLPALAGVALVPLIYVILRQLHFGRRIATLGGLLILLDNALLVESRFVLMDSILLIAGFGALSAYLALRKSKGVRRWLFTILMALVMGVLVSTKWTGLAIVGMVAAAWASEGIVRKWDWRRMAGEAVIVIVTIMTIYIASFMVHFALLKNSGDGDAFMSQRFQSTLVGNPNYNPTAKMSQWDKFIELNKEMYTAQSSLNNTTHPYASRWYSWPLMLRPIYYWQGPVLSSGAQGNIYLLGNPVIWLPASLAAITALVLWLGRPQWLGSRRRLVAFLLFGYALNFVPFAFIDRPMFLYHYLFAFVLSILLLCVLMDRLFEWQAKKYSKRAAHQTYVIVLIAIVLGFLYFLPISYGWPIGPDDLQSRMWLPSWR